MRACFQVEIVTPKKYILNGLWFGPKKPKRMVVWVHGLGSSLFTKLGIIERLVDAKTAVLVFNNRGHDKVTSVSRIDGKRIKAGAVHEVFTDCVDDIQGAINFVKREGAKNIFLAGHSTGCQKAIYWASKKGRGVKGIVILGPMSDYSAESLLSGKKKITRATTMARAYLKGGKKNFVLPENIWGWPWIADAQRFMSLYSGNSAEEIFTYWDKSKNPRTLASVRIPILVMLAEKEEFSNIPAKQLAQWFEQHIRKGRTVVVPKVAHSFKGAERPVAAHIKRFIGR